MKPGLVTIKGKSRPFFSCHEINIGRQKGQVEVLIRQFSKGQLDWKKALVSPLDIRRYPGQPLGS